MSRYFLKDYIEEAFAVALILNLKSVVLLSLYTLLEEDAERRNNGRKLTWIL